MIQGFNHITIGVRDLERSFAFYKDVLEFKPLMKHSKGAYFLAGDSWFCLDLDPSVRTAPLPEYTHFAFGISKEDFSRVAKRIVDSGSIIWKENRSEGDSLYFLDPDNHKLELHVGNWQTRMSSIREKPWDDSIIVFDNNLDIAMDNFRKRFQ